MADLQDYDNYALQKEISDGWDQAKSGILTAEINGYEKKLFFQDGVVQFASSSDPDDKLPQICIRQGKFTEEQYDAVAPNFKPDVSVGRNLVEMGLITQQELIQGAKAQVYHIFESVMLSPNGKYDFDTDDAPENLVNLPLTFPDDLFKSILNLDDPKWLSEQFGPNLNFVCERNADKPINFKRTKVADFAEGVWELIDGERDFNEIAFESDIDDRKLLKFIYALDLLNFVQVHQEDAPDDEASEDGEFDSEEDAMDRALLKDELSGAAGHSDGIQQLANIPMDETVELSSMKDLMDQGHAEAHAAMEATTEISRDVLKEAPAEEDSEDAFEDDWNTPVSGALDQEDDPPEDGDEEDEAGLDDLGEDPDIDNVLEEELAKMEVPLEEFDSEPEVEEGDEDQSDKPSLVARLKEKVSGLKARLGNINWKSDSLRGNWKKLLLGLVFLALAVATLFIDFNTLLNGPTPEETLDQDLATIEQANQDTDATGTDTDATATDEAVDGQTDSTEVVDATETTTDAVTDNPETNADNSSDQVTPPADTEPVEIADTTPDPAVEQPPLEPEAIQATNTTETTPDQEQAHTNPSLSFRSPIAEGWDPNSGLPQGQKPREPATQPQPRRQTATNTTPTPTSVKPPATQRPQQQQPDQNQAQAQTQQPQFIEPVRIDDNDAPIATPQDIPIESAADQPNPRQLLENNQLNEAAASWREQMQGQSEKYTLALFLACQPQSVRDAYQKVSASEGFFALPYAFNGRNCYWACAGTFDTYGDALNQLTSMRQRFPGVDISVKALNQILQ